MIKLSVIIITLNEERNLPRCLRSVEKVADEILVLDSFSTDQTKAIAESFGARVIQRDFEGYVESRRYIESQSQHPYILAIDADEALSDELAESILKLKSNWEKDGYCVARKSNYCGQWINHSGWYPDRKLRLYRKGSGQWEGKYVHEKFILSEGKTSGRLSGDLQHYSYYKVEEHWKRTEKYARLAALELFEDGKKTTYFQAYFKTIIKFMRDYLKNAGFLDGKAGYTISKITAWGTYQKYHQLLLMNKKK